MTERSDAAWDRMVDMVKAMDDLNVQLNDQLAKAKVDAAFARATAEATRTVLGKHDDSYNELVDRFNAKCAELAKLRGRASEVQKYWRDWPSERRAKVHALSQFLAGAIEDLAVTVEQQRDSSAPDSDRRGCDDSCRCYCEPIDLELCGDSERLLHVTEAAAAAAGYEADPLDYAENDPRLYDNKSLGES